MWNFLWDNPFPVNKVHWFMGKKTACLVVRLLYMVRIVVLNIGSTGFQCGPHKYLRFLLVLSHLSISLLVVTYDLFLQVGRRQHPQLPPYMLWILLFLLLMRYVHQLYPLDLVISLWLISWKPQTPVTWKVSDRMNLSNINH